MKTIYISTISLDVINRSHAAYLGQAKTPDNGVNLLNSFFKGEVHTTLEDAAQALHDLVSHEIHFHPSMFPDPDYTKIDFDLMFPDGETYPVVQYKIYYLGEHIGFGSIKRLDINV